MSRKNVQFRTIELRVSLSRRLPGVALAGSPTQQRDKKPQPQQETARKLSASEEKQKKRKRKFRSFL